LLLVIPHVVWVVVWGVAAVLAAVGSWIATLVTGQPPAGLHGFLSRYVRYLVHVSAYLWLVAEPYPGFGGREGTYPVDVRLPGPGPQSRWKTFLRIVLAIPALLVNSALGAALFVSAFLTWFVALGTGSAPWGLRNLSAYALRYGAQLNAYLYLLTERYPHASPLEGADDEESSFDDLTA
jgi:hypothetical protein